MKSALFSQPASCQSFLGKCDPRTKLVAFFLLVPTLVTRPISSWEWLFGAVFAVLAILGSAFSLMFLLRQVHRLRWFVITLLFFHGFFTPGQPLWDGFSSVSVEGVMEGGRQVCRLFLLASLSLILVQTTSPMQLVAGLRGLCGSLEKVGVPVARWSAIVAFTWERIPYLFKLAESVREDLRWRFAHEERNGWRKRLDRLSQGSEIFLNRVLRDILAQEESLLAEGITVGLPSNVVIASPPGWRDVVVFLAPLSLLVGAWYHG